LLDEDQRAIISTDTDVGTTPRSWYKLKSTNSLYLNLVLEIRAKLLDYGALSIYLQYAMFVVYSIR